MIIYGINTVAEGLRTGRVRSLRVAEGAGARAQELVEAAKHAGLEVRTVPRGLLDQWTHGAVHQGVAAEVDSTPTATLMELAGLTAAGPPLIVVLDGVEDPQNVGAILRSVDAAGATGVVRQIRRAAPLGGAAAKASAGAVHYVRVAEVVNIARALEELKSRGIWSVGLDANAPAPYYEIDFTVPVALVLGAEGSGLRRLVRERCDLLCAIPQAGHVSSLNVAAAAAVVLFEAVRQRRSSPRR